MRGAYLCATCRAIIAADLEPFIDTVFMECVTAGHETQIIVWVVVIETYETLRVEDQYIYRSVIIK